MRRIRPYLTRRPNFRNPSGSSTPISVSVASFSETSDSAAEFTLQSTFDTSTGGAYWYVGTSAPADVAALKAGTGAVDSGSLSLTAGVESSTISLSALTLNDDLTLYLFAENTTDGVDTGILEATSWTVGIPPTLNVSSTTANANGIQIDLTWTASAGTVYAAAYTTQADPDKATLKAGTGAAATDSDANTVGASVLSSLDDHTTYHVYIIAEKANGLDSGVEYLGTVTTPDVTAPVLGTWTVGTETTTVAPINYALTEAGPGDTTIYWVAVPTAEGAPSDNQVIAGTNASDTTPTAAGSFVYSADGSFDVTLPVGQGLAYDVYGCAVDGTGNKSSVVSVEVTLVDGVAPSVTTFSENAKASTTIDYNLEADEGSTAYIALYTSAQSPLPTGSAVETQSATLGASEAVVANTSETKQVTGLSNSTTYYAYATFKDAAGNYSTVSGPVTTTTDAVATYTFVEGCTEANDACWYDSGGTVELGASGATNVTATVKAIWVIRATKSGSTDYDFVTGTRNPLGGFVFQAGFNSVGHYLVRALIEDNAGATRATGFITITSPSVGDIITVHAVADSAGLRCYLDGGSETSVAFTSGYGAGNNWVIMGDPTDNPSGATSTVGEIPEELGFIACSIRQGTALTAGEVSTDFSNQTPASPHLSSATYAYDAADLPSDPRASWSAATGGQTLSYNTSGGDTGVVKGTVAP